MTSQPRDTHQATVSSVECLMPLTHDGVLAALGTSFFLKATSRLALPGQSRSTEQSSSKFSDDATGKHGGGGVCFV